MTSDFASPATKEPAHVTITADERGQRLDRVLATRLPGLSRSRIKALILSGQVSQDGRTLGDPGQPVKPGDRIAILVPEPVAAEPEGEAMDLGIVFEDAHLIVIDKPAGLVVHPAAGHPGGTLVNALIAHCGDSLSGIGGVKRPGIVHRLDKETSGLLVVAKTDTAHRALADQFAAHGLDGRLRRTYLALAWGVPETSQARIEARVGRSPANRTRMAVVKGEAGRHAVTHVSVVTTYRGAAGITPLVSQLRLELETGRTHQIRVHLAHIGHPVLGDPVYGQGFKASARRLNAGAQLALEALGRQALHAMELGFEHPVTGKSLHFISALPADMARLVVALAGQSGSPMATDPIKSKSNKR